MSHQDQKPNPSGNRIQRLIEKSRETNLQPSLSRRHFIIGGAAVPVALALLPLKRVLAVGDPALALLEAYPDPSSKLWLLFEFARGAASVMGFGGLFETAYSLLDTFVLHGKLSSSEKKNAEGGLTAAWGMIQAARTIYGNHD